MWWDADCIERTVTRDFVCSQLLPEEIVRLDRPLSFGGGLTDGTYWEWIDEKAKKLFLILVDLGIPDQIFGIIDDSWDDEDLPIALDHVERLALTPNKDERCERKFYQRQFHYLLQLLGQGEHIIYQDHDVVPIDLDRRTGGSTSRSSKSVTGNASSSSSSDRVSLPNYPGLMFSRQRVPLAPTAGSTYGTGYLSLEDFHYEINCIRNLQNEHLVSYFASYVHRGYGYILFTPASDFNLKSLLTTTPSCVKNLNKKERRQLIFNWILCLVDTLCFLHNRGLSYGNIKPSTVLFNNENRIFYADFTRLSESATIDKSTFDKEAYDYAAPEQWYRPSGSSSRKGTFTGGDGRTASISIYSSAGLSASPDAAYPYSNSGSSSFSISRNAGDHSASAVSAALTAPNPQLNAQAADVFSLGCIILELLSFMMKRQSRAFATHRSAKHKTPGRGGAVLDASFHKNLGQVESWMTGLARDASSKKKEDPTLEGVAPIIHVVERMLSLHTSERPSVYDVQTRMYQILRENCGIAEPHCVHQYSGWEYQSMGSLKLSTSFVNFNSVASASSLTASYGSPISPMTSPGSPGATDYYSYMPSTPAASYVDNTTMSIPGSKRHSSVHSSRHGRTDSSSGGGRSMRGSRSSAGSGATSAASAASVAGSSSNSSGRGAPTDESHGGLDLTDGLQAIRNLQIRDKVRQPWNAPVYAA